MIILLPPSSLNTRPFERVRRGWDFCPTHVSRSESRMAPRWPPAPWWPPASSCLPQSWERFPSARCLRQKAGRGRVGREGSIGAGVVLEQRELPLHLLKRGCVAMLTKLKRGFVIFYVFQKHLITQYVSIYFRAFWLSLSTSYCLKHRWLDHEKSATLCVGPGGGVWNGRRNGGQLQHW